MLAWPEPPEALATTMETVAGGLVAGVAVVVVVAIVGGAVALDETQWDVTTAPLGYKRTPTAAAQAVSAPFDETQWETTTAPLGFRRPDVKRAPASASRPFDESQWNTSTAPLGYRK